VLKTQSRMICGLVSGTAGVSKSGMRNRPSGVVIIGRMARSAIVITRPNLLSPPNLAYNSFTTMKKITRCGPSESDGISTTARNCAGHWTTLLHGPRSLRPRATLFESQLRVDRRHNRSKIKLHHHASHSTDGEPITGRGSAP
jgi:hypothetical protein